MTREWKVGKVALVTLTHPHRQRGRGPFLMQRDVSGAKEVWRLASTGIVHEDHETADVRPLVVLDPEKFVGGSLLPEWLRGQARAIERLGTGPIIEDLRTLADEIERQAYPRPPKPDEPVGLGAVVEIDGGELFVRDKTTTTVAHWKRARGQEHSVRHKWSDLPVVRVLSQGVLNT